MMNLNAFLDRILKKNNVGRNNFTNLAGKILPLLMPCKQFIRQRRVQLLQYWICEMLNGELQQWLFLLWKLKSRLLIILSYTRNSKRLRGSEVGRDWLDWTGKEMLSYWFYRSPSWWTPIVIILLWKLKSRLLIILSYTRNSKRLRGSEVGRDWLHWTGKEMLSYWLYRPSNWSILQATTKYSFKKTIS
jgi:hypothetical protein